MYDAGRDHSALSPLELEEGRDGRAPIVLAVQCRHNDVD